MTEKATQYNIDKKTGQVGAHEIIEYYNVHESDLFIVYNKLVSLCEKNGINVVLNDLSHIEEENETEIGDHKETCTSDGQTVYLHDTLSDHGGIMTRVYDVLHMGCGHLIQRGSDKTMGLTRYGEDARAIGSKFHVHADNNTLKNVFDYEREASRIALFYLQKTLSQLDMLQSDPKNIIQLYNDYIHTDGAYIMTYYKTGKSTNFFGSRKYDQPLLTPQTIDNNNTLHIKKRCIIDIGLIRST